MYMVKAQKKLADIERKEKEDRRIEALGGLKIVQGAISPDIPSDGPKGAKKKVKYVGSFKVFPPPGLTGESLSKAVSDYVWDRASGINPKRISNPISGTLTINRYGIRLYKDKSVFMSYSIKKISYCTAVPKNATFAIVTRAAQQQATDPVYCHIFALSNAEQASELSQYMSHAFKLAVAQSTLRRSIKAEDKKDKKKSKTPWEVLKRSDKKQTTTATASASSTTPSSLPVPPSRETKSKNRKSNYLNPPPPVAPGYSPQPERRVASNDITVEGLQQSITLLEQELSTTEQRLSSISPASDDALELTIQLSSIEDQLQVKKGQLFYLQQMSYQPSVPPTAPLVQPIPPPTAPLVQPIHPPIVPTPTDILPPSYNDMYGGGAVGGVDIYGGGTVGGADFGDDTILVDADWYQAGLPREIVMDILAYQSPGSFIVRDSTSNPGCHALSVKSPDGTIMHFLIGKDYQGYFLQGCNRYHTTLLALITYHASYVEFIPTLLSLGSTNLLVQPHQQQTDSNNGNQGTLYPWIVESDDSDIDDDEMVHQLQSLQMINP